ncbi:hypothetical protein [Trujillonella endophytica]|uniref:Lipoprotein n=1 Tax=Trujillonella endophytica TaxID=673521 RepID=A0A1H8WQ64_9ACTN|nr:hypothetical protein [Trujillella endophytica]SEP29643.1 hypothetical protein SAMN05660991_04618 [Trujillella endophytica]
MHTRRTLAAAVAAGLLVGLSACSSDDSGAPASPSAAELSEPPAVESPAVQTPAEFAQEFAELALTDLDVLNADGIAAALPVVEDFLSDGIERTLLAAGEQSAWSVVPFHVDGMFGGPGDALEADATTVSSTAQAPGEDGSVKVDTVVKTTWVYANAGAIYGERRYTFTLREGLDGTQGWLIDEVQPSYGTFGRTPECGGFDVPETCRTS